MKLSKILVFALLLLPSLAMATSGACSSHGGVSCDAGADYDGSVICNDGWTDSSVSFYSMSQCSTPTYVPTCYLPSKENFNCKSVSAMAAITGMTGSSGDKTAECNANQAQADIKYQEQYANYKDCFLKQGYNVDTGKVDFSEIKKTETKQQKQDREDETCKEKYNDPNSHAEDGYCVCDDGYELYDEVCEPKIVSIPSVVTPEVETPKITPVVVPITKTVIKQTVKVEPVKTEVKVVELPPEPVETIIPKIETPKKVPFYKRWFGWLFN